MWALFVFEDQKGHVEKVDWARNWNEPELDRQHEEEKAFWAGVRTKLFEQKLRSEKLQSRWRNRILERKEW